MASNLIDLNRETSVIAYHDGGEIQFLTKPDPSNLAIRFTLRVDATNAISEIVIPIRYKDNNWAASAIAIRINPSSITSLTYSTERQPPDAVKEVPPTAICLHLQLDKSISTLIPIFIKEPVIAARRRSGKILDFLYELSQITNLRIYISNSAALSSGKLTSSERPSLNNSWKCSMAQTTTSLECSAAAPKQRPFLH
ncbi:hypothetical protein F53441_6821 [Fusarium austroafricanum]|uniref:Uncharacterized protein n=1 Tax=Fusarium austroafricanum TaxID=2364996 RepID=A0A8H4NY83_9HYPO|nr:hypothetical protein F53441_6821 [Fusarium austroafricanum]